MFIYLFVDCFHVGQAWHGGSIRNEEISTERNQHLCQADVTAAF